MIIANIDDYREQCEARLPRFLHDYISGGSYQENTLRANIVELQATLLRQRVLVDESHLNLSIKLWDQALSLRIDTRRRRLQLARNHGAAWAGPPDLRGQG
jgi:L-lactate dehydrogenase (cytochrome)